MIWVYVALYAGAGLGWGLLIHSIELDADPKKPPLPRIAFLIAFLIWPFFAVAFAVTGLVIGAADAWVWLNATPPAKAE